ncbi:MAG: hypothetical protein E7212_08265 [Clostridium sartagoforme]|nr:hypothetical protein [Clostridium sartagoforme]
MSSIAQKRKDNNKISKNLTEENIKIYTDFVCYLRVSDLREEEQEEIISDVLLMFLQWQQEGKSIENMVGGNLKKFADDTIAAVNPHKTMIKKIIENLGIIIECFCIMLTIDFVFLYLNKVIKGNTNISYDFDLSMLFRGVIFISLAFYIINYIGKNSFDLSRKGKHSKLSNFIFGVCIAGLIIFTTLISKVLSGKVIFSLNIIYVAVVIGVYWFYRGVRKFWVKK